MMILLMDWIKRRTTPEQYPGKSQKQEYANENQKDFLINSMTAASKPKYQYCRKILYPKDWYNDVSYYLLIPSLLQHPGHTRLKETIKATVHLKGIHIYIHIELQYQISKSKISSIPSYLRRKW